MHLKPSLVVVVILVLVALPRSSDAQASAYRDLPERRAQLQADPPPQLVKSIYFDLFLAFPDCRWSDYLLLDGVLLPAARVACSAIAGDRAEEECFEHGLTFRDGALWDRLESYLNKTQRTRSEIIAATIQFVRGVLPQPEETLAREADDPETAYNALVRSWRTGPMCRPERDPRSIPTEVHPTNKKGGTPEP